MIEGLKTGMTRRKAIKTIGLLSVLPLAGLWYSLVNRQIRRRGQEVVRIVLDQVPEGMSYHDRFVISKMQNDFVVFSTSCTHLGCRLKPGSAGQLTCPCHGSAFSTTDGKPWRGPALKSLKKLDFHLTDKYIEISLNQ